MLYSKMIKQQSEPCCTIVHTYNYMRIISNIKKGTGGSVYLIKMIMTEQRSQTLDITAKNPKFVVLSTRPRFAQIQYCKAPHQRRLSIHHNTVLDWIQDAEYISLNELLSKNLIVQNFNTHNRVLWEDRQPKQVFTQIFTNYM